MDSLYNLYNRIRIYVTVLLFVTSYSVEAVDYLCFTAEEAASCFYISNENRNSPDLQYSLDEGQTWTQMRVGDTIMLRNEGDKAYLKGDNPAGFSRVNNTTRFGMKGTVAVSGNVMTLIDEVGLTTEIPCDYCFADLFIGCPITSAPELPALTLKEQCYYSMFTGCEKLKKAPELPATQLARFCYRQMFQYCSSIVSTPDLPATELDRGCYYYMFSYCDNLSVISPLNASVLSPLCYSGMFAGCMSLLEAPELPAIDLAESCYSEMFYECKNLKKASVLPATQLANSCYFEMFAECESLTDVPDFHFKELAEYSCGLMFYNCTSLERAPEFPAVELKTSCYERMFVGCTNLNYIKVNLTTLDNNVDATKDWVFLLHGEGKFIFPCGSTYDKHGYSQVPSAFTIISSPIIVFLNPDSTEIWRDTIPCNTMAEYKGETPTYEEGYVFKEWDKELIVHKEPDIYCYMAIYEKKQSPDVDLSKCLCFTAEEAGSKVWYVNGAENNPKVQYSLDGRNWSDWSADTPVTLANIGDKIYVRGDNPNGFSHDNSSNDANGPGTTNSRFKMSGRIAASGSVMSLIDGVGTSTKIPCAYCFSDLFRDCVSLTKAPELPATELAPSCYALMFQKCTNLTNAPELPATKLATKCYTSMFLNCSSLVDVPAMLPATKMETGCYWGMFAYCSKLIKSPELSATELAPRCYNSMFIGCESLAEAPELVATTLADSCYYKMFSGCTSLVKAPELPADSWKKGCYSEMFKGCTSLNYIKVNVLTLDNDLDATKNWVDGIDGAGRFIFLCGSKYDKHGASEVPTNFTIVGSPIVIFQNPDGKELYRDTIGCDVLPEYKGETPTYGDGFVFKDWDPALTIHDAPGTYYYTAVYEEKPVAKNNWLCFTAEEAGSTVGLYNVNNEPDIHYSLDSGQTWVPWAETDVVTLKNVGDKVYVKGVNPDGFSHTIGLIVVLQSNPSSIHNTSFRLTGRIAASGSLMSLIDGVGEAKEIPCEHCFSYLFSEQTALVSAPELTATTMKRYCYVSMFRSCSNLIQTPELPATQLASGCYSGMFIFCDGLTKASALPATQLTSLCYNCMFYGCSSLTEVPDLPATTLRDSCYRQMFGECTSLTKAPELLATTWAKDCYTEMFKGCTSLNYIKVNVLTLDNNFNATKNWVDGIDGDGVFIFPCGSKYDKHGVSEVPENFIIIGSPIVVFQNPDGKELYRDTIGCDVLPVYRGETPTYGDGLVFKGWDKKLTIHEKPDTYYYTAVYGDDVPVQGDWLCFTAEEDNAVVSYMNVGNNHPNVMYSVDEGKTWKPLQEDEKVELEKQGDKVYLKGDNPTGFSKDEDNYTHIWTTGSVSASGSVMSLIDEEGLSTVIPNDYCFYHLFANSPALIKAPELPATELKKSCYEGMFENCAVLESVPALPATTLEDWCYKNMFGHCSKIKETPILPATTLAKGCYSTMFSSCMGVTKAPLLPATEMADSCYYGMFSGCYGLTEAPVLPSTHLAKCCYGDMFWDCWNLEVAPALPATELAESCYEGMFNQCGNLTKAPVLQAAIMKDFCYSYMFSGCGKLLEAPELPATKLALSCYEGMFLGCENLTKAPDLPAQELAPQCYMYMFEGCTNITYIKVGVLSLDNDFDATYGWGVGVNKEGVFIFPCGSKYDKHGVSAVPENFKIIGSPVVIFQNPDGIELYRDTIACDVVAEYKGETPTYGEGLVFKGWDPELTIHPDPDTFYYTAVYEEEQTLITDISKCLCFTAEKANSYVYYQNHGGNAPDVQYSIDEGRTWQSWGENEVLILKNVGEKIYVRGTNPDGFSHMANLQKSDGEEVGQFTNFKMSGEIAASGSVMSLIDGKGESLVIPCDYCFAHLFNSTRNPQQHEDVMTTALTKAPELPATTLTMGCYLDMFGTCSLLKEAPVLPATELASSCYVSMFNNCRSLEIAPALPATKLSKYCYEGMFSNSGIVVAPELPATDLMDSCYWGMFRLCKNMESAPELLATELKPGCYEGMFAGCSNLNYIKVGVMTLDNDFAATNEWVTGVNGPGTFIFPCGSKYDKHGVSEVPVNFKIISSPVVIFQNPDGEELYRDTIGCDVLPEYKGETPTYGEGLVFKGWDKELMVHTEPDTFYYTAVYEGQAPITDVSKCLCFTIEEIGSWIWYESPDEHIPNVEYSIDGGKTWQPFMRSETWGENKLVFENVGDKIYVRGINPEGFSISKEHPTKFHISGKVAASGSVMSLIDGKGSSTEIPSEYCFRLLFEACSLTQAPELPATTLTKGCYDAMFNGCTKLTQAPALPATTLVESCYQMMFAGCEMLQMAPELLSTTLADSCYSGMFYICESLKTAPALPATTLASYCYSFMFAGCHRLTEAPELPATELKAGCYEAMFLDCPRLNYIKVGVMTLDNDFDATMNWVQEIDGEGVFIFPCGSKYDKHGISEVPDNFKIISSPVVVFQNPDGEELYRDTIGCDVVAEYKGETPTYGEGLVFKGWDPELTIHPEPDTFYYTAVYEEDPTPITDVSKCLCFTAEEAGSEVMCGSPSYNPDIQYSIDGGRTWHVLSKGEKVLLANVGDKVYFRGNNPNGLSNIGENSTSFVMNGSIAASGSVMSLIDGVGESKVIPNDGCFIGLFQGCSSLTQAPELPATTLTKLCYYNMFTDCVNLTKTPELPALTLEESCYSLMFWRCTGLTSVSELPATTLAEGCYSSMFNGCTSLTDIPDLPATTLTKSCYSDMFSWCTSLTKAPKLPATTLAGSCYASMFEGCSLINAPDLPATELADACYAYMFSNCTSLTNAPELPATTLVENCYNSMFLGCTSLTAAPELPATELVENCYGRMFYGCENLNYIKVGVMSLDNNFEYGSTDRWVSGVDGPGVFIFPCGSTYDKHGESEVPDNFDILRGIVTVIFQNPDSTVLWKETINCNEVPEYKGETPTMGEDYFFIGWDKELTAVGEESVYYITAMYQDLNKYESLHLTVDDALYLVLPGGNETIGYELLEGGGSRYEIWYDGVMITEGAVTNDSTVQLICPEDFIPGAYTATLVMYDAHNGRGASDFVFHVMLKDDPTNSYYVKVWNDVVICRNGDNKFVSYQWYKNRNIVEGATFQYYNDVELLDGEYLVYVTDQSGKSYFIEPKQFERVEASYSITAEPSIVNRGVGFTVVVSEVEPEQLKNARIVVYRNDGVVVNILDDVELENEMHLAAIGDYVIVLTVNDGKNANCKVLIK